MRIEQQQPDFSYTSRISIHVGETMTKFAKLPIKSIAWDDNIRSSRPPGRTEELAASMKIHGQLVPIRARIVSNVPYGIDGLGRCQAAMQLGWETILAQIEERELSPSDILAQELAANCLRDDLSLLDKGRNLEQLMALRGQTLTQTAVETGFSPSTAIRWIQGHRLPDPLRDLVERNELGLTVALELVKNCPPDELEQATAAALSGRLTRDALIGKRKRAPQSGSPAKTSAGSRFSAPAGNGCSVTVTGACGELDLVIGALEDLLNRARRARTKGHTASTFSKMLRDEASAVDAEVKDQQK